MGSSAKRAAIYVRVSTDKQTVENQVRELTAIAQRRGWEIVATYNDAGISGAKGRDQRPGLDEMLKDASRRRFDIVLAWAIDRLGRSLVDLLGTIQTLEAAGVDLFIEQQSVDTTSPMGKLLFQITGAFAEFERKMIAQRVAVGIKRARANGVKFGRPKMGSEPNDQKAKARRRTEGAIREALAKGDKGMLKIAAEFGVGSGTVQRIKAEMAAANA
jgi:DNA invertase Pin-like site-specific DNA recombinase